ncbi:MAG: hypothetical protein WAS90_00120 [Brachymonas denitrificans]
MDIFIAYPVLAAVVALVLGLLAGKPSSKPLALAAALWLLYAGYETLMHFRVLCPEGCNIRVDLLLITPLLLGMTLYGLYRAVRGPKKS